MFEVTHFVRSPENFTLPGGELLAVEDSFLLGEVALFCFLLLVLSGIFLGFFFEPSTSDVEYDGSVQKFQGEEMPEAFVSVLHITYDVPFGMFIRRLHHWAAHLFVASIGLHMLRVFFTGAYRNPREPNWIVGTGLAALSMGAAYTGYALPFDEFAATATSIGYNLTISIPLLGDFLGQVVFGGEFPSSATIPRLYFLHVLVIPMAIAVGLGLHMAILMRQKHTEAPREGDVRTGRETVDEADDDVIIGLPAFPNQTAVSAVVFFVTAATLSALAGLLPVHNVAEYGPNDPEPVEDETVATLIADVEHSSKIERRRAALALKDRETTDAVVTALAKAATTDDDSDVRQFAVEALTAHGGERAAAVAVELLDDPDPWVRAEAVVTLDNVDRAAHEDDIESAVRDDHHAVRRNAAISLFKLRGEAMVDLLLEQSRDDSERVREWAAHMLGGVDEDRARERLRELTDDPATVVRQTAERSLEVDPGPFRRQFGGALENDARLLPGEDRLNRMPDL